MRQVSSGFIEASLSPIGYANAYVTINGTTIDASKLTEITIQENIGESGAFSIGSFNTSEISITALTSALPQSLSGVPINAYFGYYVNGSYEYVPMGTFYAQAKDITRQSLHTTIRAYDRSIRLTDKYTSSLDWSSSHTVAQVLSEIQTATSLTMGSYGGLAPSSVTVYAKPKGSYRDVLRQMALLMGTNAKLNKTGSLDFIKAYPSTAVQSYGPYNYKASDFQLTSNAPISFGKLTVKYKHKVSGQEQTDTFTYTAGSGSNTITLDTVNVRTQAKTDTLGQAIYGTSGLSYYGYNATLPGQPQIDLGDTIRIEDVFGQEYDLLVLSATHTFNGAMKTTFSAVANEQDPTVDGNNVGASLTEQVSTINDAATYAVNQAELASIKADEASASAERAETQADIATENANTAIEQSNIATENANEAIRQSGIATDNANEAIRQAGIATENADEARSQAFNATKYATSALDQLGVVQDVVGVLDWATTHGSFVHTTDTTIQEGKVYFTYDPSTGDYTPVVTPEQSQLSNYYELSIDEAMESFIMSHLAVTARGLWVLPNGYGSSTDAQFAPNYKVLLANDGLYVYDGEGVLVSKYGESIDFSSTRRQSIGNNDAYIVFDPEGADGQGTLTIGGATIHMGDITLEQLIGSLSVRNLIRNSKDLIYTNYGFESVTFPTILIDELSITLTDEDGVTLIA